jgi:signal transduction histidine kinase
VEDTLGASDIEVRLIAPEPSQDLKLGADVRREVFLILKESVNNVVKHADATRVEIEFVCDRRRLRLRVSDNGKGFQPAAQHDTAGGGAGGPSGRRLEARAGHDDRVRGRVAADYRGGAETTAMSSASPGGSA